MLISYNKVDEIIGWLSAFDSLIDYNISLTVRLQELKGYNEKAFFTVNGGDCGVWGVNLSYCCEYSHKSIL